MIIIFISCLAVLYFVIYLAYFWVSERAIRFNYDPIHYSRDIVGAWRGWDGGGGGEGNGMNERTSGSLCVGF